MFNIENIIKILDDKLENNFSINKKLIKKPTARSLQKYILADKNNKKYLLEIATNSIEIFYFKRTIKHQEEFKKLEHSFKLNMPLYVQSGNKLSYAIYEYFEDIIFLKDDLPIKLINEFYKINAIKIELNTENIEKILSNFLSTWPNNYHSMIKRQREFKTYKNELKNIKTIKVSFEHGDFNAENIAKINNDNYLIDFEFSKDFQPIEFDIYDYFKLKRDAKTNVEHYELHKIKYQLIDKINEKIDDDSTIEIYEKIDDDSTIRDNWNKLYNNGANYNLSLVWCETWIKYFQKNNQQLFIFTIWKDNELMLLAPLLKYKNKLFLIGTNPDLFDSFNILYTDTKYIKYFLDYLHKKNYILDFRYLDANSDISKILVKYLYQNDIAYNSQIIDTKPKTNFDTFKIKTKENSDVKRLKHRAIKNYDEELKFNFSVKKDSNTMNEFISIHKERWDGGPFESIKNYDSFIKDISQTDLVVISKLSIQNETVAYHFAYKDSNSILNSAIPSYSNKFNDISPGKVLLYEVLNYCKNNKDKTFDFGRGAEEYKYWFSNESSILFHIQTHNNKNIITASQKLINRIFNKLNRVFYA